MTWFRQMAFWLGIILISLSWRVAFHTVTAPDGGLALLASLTGTSCLVVSGAILSGHGRRLRCAARALVAAGALFLVTGLSTGSLLRAAPALHDIPVPAWLGPAVEWASPRLSLVNGLVGFWDGRGLHRVRLTFEGLGLYEVWYLAVGISFAYAVLAGRREMGGAVKAVTLLIFYALFRFALVAAFAVEFNNPGLIWHPAVAIASYLPVATLLARFTTLACRGVVPSMRRLSVVAVLAAASMVLLALPSPGIRRISEGASPARVVIDESHSNWEWATEPFDTASFGVRAEYNYYCFARYLDEFHEVRVSSARIAPGCLDSCDVLIIKTPTERYEPDEIDAIVEFVRNGGGLLLIGDHTNLFGMTSHLNAIGEKFGLRFRCDDTFDLATCGFSQLVDMGFWSHPVARGLEGFSFLTSCTIDGDLGIEPLMLGLGLGSEDGDYGHPNFFGNISYDLADRFGVFLQAGARRFGDGVVVLFTDSTCFSNFCMFSPRTPELALNLVGFLAGGRHGEGHGSRTVLVDTTHSRATFFQHIGLNRRPPWQRFEEFYLSLIRKGMVPRAGGFKDIEKQDASRLVLVNPQDSFTRWEIERVHGFVAGGGRLLVLDSVLNSSSVANEVLQLFGMGVITRPAGLGSDRRAASQARLDPVLEIVGGEAVAADSAGRVVISRATCGTGAVTVAVDSYAYSEAGLGRPLQPKRAYDTRLSRYHALFGLIDLLR